MDAIEELQGRPTESGGRNDGALRVDAESLTSDLDDETIKGLSKEDLLRLALSQRQCIEDFKKAAHGSTKCGTSPAGPEDKPSDLRYPKAKRRKNRMSFDFSRFKLRHVALKFLYLGWDYKGFVVQDDTDRTIEAVIFEALYRTKLVRDRETSNYHRCGRTDKGVSAFSQVITLDLRSNLEDGVGVVTPPDYRAGRTQISGEEIDYVKILNRVLPAEIRMIAWSPVDPRLSARFDCRMRSYRYFFPRGRLKVESMREASRLLEGENDFRNLCKMDVGNGVTQFRRRVEKCWIEAPDGSEAADMCCFVIRSNAFLWHQIRCIVAVLLLVGEGKESPSIVSDLLDVGKNPRKPQYSMASEVALCLYDSEYDSFEWIYCHEVLNSVIDGLIRLWSLHSIKVAMISSMVKDLCSISKYDPRNHADCLSPGPRSRTHKPLLERETCDSLESRIEYYAKKRSQE
ncbi:tRNA pseudouridine(38/39) synthase [Galendromus occidentalis]|uniref:tRNA pseudouridine(38/39) synthase n=1 Tax=Galendromus occidentalis TaxID=34638 RepID=A0AAJ6VW43_9ACAR|nr:tRNA pseudouridine(38/39) synthase [Galendromus occidentalis]